jgi:nucleotide-binding universal stress UspA family protein
MRGASHRPRGAPGPGGRPARPAAGPAPAAVLVGLDRSGTSWDAFWWACGEARRLGGRVVAVFVSSPIDSCMAAMASASASVAVCDYAAVDQAAAEQAAGLRAEVQRHGDADGLEVGFIHARGAPARELLRLAGEVGAELIVVGRSMKARHQITGSLGRSLAVRRHAPVVVVVP